MIFNIILIILITIAVVILGFVIFKKLPQLRIMNPASLPEARNKQVKHEILQRRIERTGGESWQAVNKRFIKPIVSVIQNVIRRVAGKLTAVERRYKEKQKEAGNIKLDKKALRELIDEGIKLMDEEAWDRAEKKFIEVIGADPKNVEAYEKLGRLYLFKKDYALAKQTFKFLSKLSKNDASVIASLGEVEEKLGSQESALTYFKEAVRLSSKNPKYLDFLITSAIANKDLHEAMSALDQLKAVNPENKKIEVFEKKIDETRAEMKQKGTDKTEKSTEKK